jgi:GT2 family glycosyltransferase
MVIRVNTETVIDSAQAVAARPDAGWPAVTVGVLAFNRRDAVRTTLKKLTSELDYPADRLEVVVVDNASGDGTSEMLAAEFPAARVVRLEENVGVSGWNEVLPRGDGEWFLLVDDDCYLEADALKRAVAAAEVNHAALVSFRVRSGVDDTYLFNDEYATGLLSFWGCAGLVSRRALEELQGYDPFIFIWANELDFTMRLLDAGYRHLYLPDVVAIHMKAPNQEFSVRADRMNRRHWAYIAAKQMRAPDAVRVVGRMLAALVVDPRTRAAGGRSETLRLVLGGVAGGLRNRRPARPEVSAAYRDNFESFANPLRFVRRPMERLPGAPEPRDRYATFRASRRKFYPTGPAVLGL